MADTKISALTELTGGNVDTAADLLPIVDTGATETKKIKVTELVTAIAATQAQMEAASSNSVLATPGRMQHHPGVSKAWARFNGTGTPAIDEAYNISGVADGGTGLYTLTIVTDFSAATYCVTTGGSVSTTGATNRNLVLNTKDFAVGTILIEAFDTANPTDPAIISIDIKGDQ